MGGTGQDMGWERGGKERRKGREREERGYSPKLQFLAPPLVLGASSPAGFGAPGPHANLVHSVAVRKRA